MTIPELPQTFGPGQPERQEGSTQLYRGWRVVAALFIVGMMVYGCGLYSFTLFITPLTHEFGWSRAATSGLVSIYWLAAPLTVVGEPFVRRFGAVRLIAAGVTLAALATFGLGFCNTLPFLFVLRFLAGVGKVMMAVGGTLLTAQWFRRRFGLALACYYAGWHFGGIVMVPMTQMLIDAIGWRETTMVLSLAILVVALPPLWLWARETSPLERGVEPETYSPLAKPIDLIHSASPFTRAFRQPILWLSIAITVLGGFAYGSILTNEAAMVDEIPALQGFGSTAVSATAFAALCGAIGMGWLADKWNFLRLFVLELGLLLTGILGFIGLYLFPQGALVLLAALTFGIAVGGFEAVVLPHMRKALQTEEFDHAYAIWYLCYLATLFVGPIGAGWVHDVTLSYLHMLILLALLAAASVMPALWIANQSRPLQRA